MPITPQDVTDLISVLNNTGQSIPLTIQSTNMTEPLQFWAMFIISLIGMGFMIFWICSIFLKPTVMGIYVKFVLLKFKKITNRNYILIKHTQQDLFSASMIDTDTLHNVEKAIQSFKGKPFDIILHTPGGAIFYTQLLAKIIKESKTPVRCFIPYYAMSGGTMLALSCSEIYMGDFACLGPIDPQIGSLFGYGSAKSWKEVIRKKGRRAADSSIQFAFMGEQYTKTIRENIRYALSGKIDDPDKLNEVLDFLTSGSIEHGYQIPALKLQELGIRVNIIPAELQKYLSKVITNNRVEGVIWG